MIPGVTDILVGDCIETMRTLPDKSVHTCVTSPPYFGLRDYGVDGQIGLEPTPDEFVAALVAVFREVRRVLRDDGTLWLNLGDSYGKAKQLLGIPWRVAFALQADGWYLRQDIIWHKPNPMPESVRDRCTKAHEYVFLLSKSPKYFFDSEAIKEPAICGATGRAATFDRSGNAVSEHAIPGQKYAQHRPRPSARKGSFKGKTEAMASTGQNAFRAVVDMRNRRSVWSVATRPYKGAHFATFPPDLIQPCILAGAPVGGVVLDPFGGAGTTALVAIQEGRRSVLCELNPEYAALAQSRIENELPAWSIGMPTYLTSFDPDTKQPTAPSSDSGFGSIEEAVAVLGDGYLCRGKRSVTYPGVFISDYVLTSSSRQVKLPADS